MIRRATVSADGVYRYLLTREWGPEPALPFLTMLNPSTAAGLHPSPKGTPTCVFWLSL